MKYHAAGFAAVITILNGLCGPQAGAETIATLTKGQSNPIVRGVRVGSETMAGKLGDKSLHFVPRTENSVPEQLSLVDEVLSNKPDALVFSPSDIKALLPAVDKFNAAGIAVVNVIDRLAGGQVVAYVGNDDYDLAVVTARYLFHVRRLPSGFLVANPAPEPLCHGSPQSHGGHRDSQRKTINCFSSLWLFSVPSVPLW